MKKIKVKGKIFDVPNYFEVRDNLLFNTNTRKYEGVDGDIVTVNRYSMSKKGHVKGYTECQIIPTYEWSTMIVSAQGLNDGFCRIDITHCTPVYEAQKGEL
jgi:hypothetical protein